MQQRKYMGLLNAPKFEEEESANTAKPSTQTASLLSPQSTTPPKKTTMATQVLTSKVVTGRVRLSYCNLFKAVLGKTAKEGDEPKFGCTLLIPKTDTVTLAKLEAAMEVAIAAKFPKRPAKINTTLHDGDGVKENGDPYGDECKGHWVMAVQSKYKPQVVDASDGNEVISDALVGSGDYAKVSLNAYAYEFSGKRGVSFGLNNVLFLEKGVSLGGKTSAFSDFADDLPQ